ncbi:MAG: HAD-IIIC family phosphatase [Myxococcales bacterium]
MSGGELGPAERRRIAALLRRDRSRILAEWWSCQFDPALLRRYGLPTVADGERPSVLRRFLRPLFELLRAALATGEARYVEVYRDERLRYAPHRASPERRTRFFAETLAGDESSLLRAIGDPRLAARLAATLETLHAPLRVPVPGQPLRILALGDCLMNEIRVSLVAKAAAAGLPLDFRQLYFSAAMGRGLAVDEPLAFLREFPADLIACSFLSYKGIAPYVGLLREAGRLDDTTLRARVEDIVGLMREFLGRLRQQTDAPFLLHDTSGLPLTHLRRTLPILPALSPARVRVRRALNHAIAELAASTPNTILVEEAAAALRVGLRASEKRLIPWRIARGADFHTARLGQVLADPLLDVALSYRALARCKVLAVDFDNTLWDGVMAEGAVRHRLPLQQSLRRLREGGILLVALSKNDPKNIRWDEMALQPEDFVLHKISWDLKVDSLERAARELNLGLDSFVLLDDSPVERELVRTQLPTVGLLDPNAERSQEWLERMLRFPNTRETEEARRRTELYREQTSRRAALQQQFDYPAMMANLGLQARFEPARKGELTRLVELAQRTNQFNTTTLRYSPHDLSALCSDPASGVYAVELADRFGKVGLVGLCVVRRHGTDRIFEAVVMSCRAMGFELERWMLGRAIRAEDGPGVRFIGRYVPTDRNTPCSGLFARNGFAQAGDTEWTLERDVPRPDLPPWFNSL